MPKEKPQVNIGEVIKTYRSQRGLSQGDIERRTGLLRCYLSRVENGHTVPSLETLAKIAEAMEISLADFFPGTETPRDKETQKMLGELSQDEIRFLAEIKKCSVTLSSDDKRLVLAMIRKMAAVVPPPARTVPSRSDQQRQRTSPTENRTAARYDPGTSLRNSSAVEFSENSPVRDSANTLSEHRARITRASAAASTFVALDSSSASRGRCAK